MCGTWLFPATDATGRASLGPGGEHVGAGAVPAERVCVRPRPPSRSSGCETGFASGATHAPYGAGAGHERSGVAVRTGPAVGGPAVAGGSERQYHPAEHTGLGAGGGPTGGAWYEQSGQGETAAQRQERVGTPKDWVYASIDGGFLPLREEDEEASRWREAKMVAWYQIRSSGAKGKPRAWDVRLHGTLEAKKAFGKLLWASGFAYGADQAEEVVFVCDGAAWIWDLVTTYFPKAVQTVDWAHAVAYVDRVAHLWAETAAQEAAAWWERQRKALWEGQVEAVIQACEALARDASLPLVQKAARQAAGYYQNHAHRMAYGAFRKAGYAIGSGVIESGIKQTVTARMKVAGAHWTQAGAEATLKARTALVERLRTTFSSLPLAA